MKLKVYQNVGSSLYIVEDAKNLPPQRYPYQKLYNVEVDDDVKIQGRVLMEPLRKDISEKGCHILPCRMKVAKHL